MKVDEAGALTPAAAGHARLTPNESLHRRLRRNQEKRRASEAAQRPDVQSLLALPLLRPLLDLADRLDVIVRFCPEPLESESSKEEVLGRCYYRLNVIHVGLCGKGGERWSEADIAFTLAHELRHAQHFMEGLYSDYYDGQPPACHKTYGLLAERDCDEYAASYMHLVAPGAPCKAHGFKLTMRHPYIADARAIIALSNDELSLERAS